MVNDNLNADDAICNTYFNIFRDGGMYVKTDLLQDINNRTQYTVSSNSGVWMGLQEYVSNVKPADVKAVVKQAYDNSMITRSAT
jgi:hypothetical protein